MNSAGATGNTKVITGTFIIVNAMTFGGLVANMRQISQMLCAR